MMLATSEDSKKLALKTSYIFTDGRGVEERSWIVPETYYGLLYVRNIKALSGDKILSMLRREHPRDNIVSFAQISS